MTDLPWKYSQLELIMFSIFDKNIQHIETKDLVVLRTINEGWFVDFKSQQLALTDYAKHMSAFANEFGGDIFIGITEGKIIG